MAQGKKDQASLEGHVSGQANKPLTRPAHALPYDTVIQELKCNPEDGLTTDEAKARHQEYGANDLGEGEGVQPGKILLRQVANAMTLVSPSILSSGTRY
jgi:magnesium-transporting ATPase (P-type)